MATKRKVEVFSAGCPACEETVQLVNSIACPSCDVSVLDMNDAVVAKRGKLMDALHVPPTRQRLRDEKRTASSLWALPFHFGR